MANTKMIVGLGNPGAKYALNRHNIGFQCIDRFAIRHHLEGGSVRNRAMVVDGWITQRDQRTKVIMVKPMTYMNASGDAVGPLARYFQVEPEDIIVIHDDLDLEMGKLRLRRDGSSGGQNGIKSLISRLGTDEFARAKIGVGRPPGRMDPAAFVLQNFTKDEEEIFDPLRDKVCDALACWLFDGIEPAMNRFNG
ncbi:MAG: aminoacyl-tRNA hydrolase [Caldilineaceae bacterium]|nr:aminoacyl-tRNA hydrolase [Caldilineaceae bacterium]